MRLRFWKRETGDWNTMREFRNEPAVLADRVLKTARKDDALDFAEFKDFVTHRFWRTFDYSVRRSISYGLAFTFLSISVIAAGVASSVFASSDAKGNDEVIAVLGLFVAVAAAVNRLLRPGQRSMLRHQTANGLRREGWAYVFGRGRYRNGDEAQRRGRFIDNVEKLNRIAEGVDEEQVTAE